MESATENNRHLLMVRVKTGGKSTRLVVAMQSMGKPYREQDKVGMHWLFVPVKHAGMSHR